MKRSEFSTLDLEKGRLGSRRSYGTGKPSAMKHEQTRTRFESLLLPLMNDAYNLARWLMTNQEDAEDIVQESYLRAFRFFASFHEGTNCRAWFLRIVRNTCDTALGARDLKQKQLPLDSATDEIENTPPLPPVSLSKEATVEAVREAIAALPVDFREVVVLRELEGLSYEEISHVNGISLGTVTSRLARARHQLYLMSKAREDINRELHDTGAQPSKAATLPVHAATHCCPR
jgi:RNA polymerase sigma factor (sigma-70 family)